MFNTYRNKFIKSCILSSIIILSFINGDKVFASETTEKIPVENETVKSIIQEENKSIDENERTVNDLTTLMGLTAYNINKDENISKHTKNIIIDVIKKDNNFDDNTIESLELKIIGKNTFKDEVDNSINEDIYLWGNYLISTQNFDQSKIGKQKVTIKYKLLSILEVKMIELSNNTETIDVTEIAKNLETDIISKNIIINVKDVTAPVIYLKQSSKEIIEGEKFKIDNYISKISDDSDKKVNYSVKGGYDINKTGTYPLIIKAEDSSGNSSEARFTLKVKKSAVKIVENAKKYRGSPYVWGGSSPAGFDCSGFIQYVFQQNGIYLPRTAALQGLSGYPVSVSEIKTGDIVIYGGGVHVALYIGNGKVIHALSPEVGVVIGQWNYPYNGEVSAIRRII